MGTARLISWLLAPVKLAMVLLDKVVADRPPSTTPPPGNWIPNSNGEGGRVISSGDSGGR